MITDTFENDLSDVDAVVTSGESLRVPTVKRLAQHLCRRVNSSKGVAIRVSEERPPSNYYCRNLIRKQLIGDCDGFV